MPGWECLFQHKAKQLFLSIYVDDFKMAGRAENLKPMWEKIGKLIELEDPTPFHQSNYLGCQQYDVEPDFKLLENKTQLIEDILRRKSAQIDQKSNAVDAKDLDMLVGKAACRKAGSRNNEDAARGNAIMLHCRNAPSPAATSSLAIGDVVAKEASIAFGL